MPSYLLSYDPATDVTEIFHWDPATNVAVIETRQPCDELLASNQSWYAAVKKDAPWKDGLGERVAVIPAIVWSELQASGITEDKKAFAKYLNDANNRKLRTRPGTI